jgi:hypothetical protein
VINCNGFAAGIARSSVEPGATLFHSHQEITAPTMNKPTMNKKSKPGSSTAAKSRGEERDHCGEPPIHDGGGRDDARRQFRAADFCFPLPFGEHDGGCSRRIGAAEQCWQEGTPFTGR